MQDEPTHGIDVVGAEPERDDWDHHWGEYGEIASANPGPTFRRRLIVDRLADVDHASRILDIGSGTGELVSDLHDVHPSVQQLGLELSRLGVEASRRRVPDAVFLQRDLATAGETPALYQGWATHAVCSEVLEHVDDPRSFLVNSSTYMARGCRLLVTVPGGPMTALDRHIGHRRHYRPADLADLLRTAGFEVLEANGVGFPAFNLYRLCVRALGGRAIGMLQSSTPSASSRAAMRAFDVLLRLSARPSRWGWQIVATARLSQTSGGR